MKIFKSLKNKKFVGLLTVVLVAAVAAFILNGNANASFGPSRPTYTWANPADHITFDSITDNPIVGDERYFLSGKDENASGGVQDPVTVTSDNEELVLRVYFHNNAASNLGLVATNTRVSILLPKASVGAATSTFATGFISADNATPQLISDTLDFNGPQPFTLEYEPGTARLTNNIFPNGAPMSDDVVTPAGALVGYNALDGQIPGCEQYSGYVTIRVIVHMQTPPVTPTPQFACTLLNTDVLPNRKVNASIQYTASGGATFSTATFNWGDGSTPLVTSNTSASYTYAKDGTYTITSTLAFDTGSTPQTAICSKTITITTPTPPVVTTTSSTPPAALPNTGPASTFAIFAGVTGFAGAFHYLWSGRKQRGL